MSIKSGAILLILSVVLTYVVAMADFALGISKGDVGLPLGFSSFGFLGGNTDLVRLFVDVISWFGVLFAMKFIFSKFFVKH